MVAEAEDCAVRQPNAEEPGAERPDEAVEAYRQLMERMAPDVIVIPTLCVTASDDVPAIHRRLREISREYAQRMDWGWA